MFFRETTFNRFVLETGCSGVRGSGWVGAGDHAFEQAFGLNSGPLERGSWILGLRVDESYASSTFGPGIGLFRGCVPDAADTEAKVEQTETSATTNAAELAEVGEPAMLLLGVLSSTDSTRFIYIYICYIICIYTLISYILVFYRAHSCFEGISKTPLDLQQSETGRPFGRTCMLQLKAGILDRLAGVWMRWVA